jgi:hypothetical protein
LSSKKNLSFCAISNKSVFNINININIIMKWLIILAAVAVAVQGRAQQQRRGGRQLDTGYGAPAEASYGAPSEQIDVRSQELPGYDDNLSSYEGGDLDAQASNLDAREGEEESENGLDMLMKSVPGIPGEDYPIYAEAPETEFSCDTGVNGGYYADPDAECQVFHICTQDGNGGLAKYSFLCPNGTIFNQNYFICDWWFNVDCSEAAALAEAKNNDLAAARDSASARLAEAADLDAAASAPGGYGAPLVEDRVAAESANLAYGAPAEEEYVDENLSGYAQY